MSNTIAMDAELSWEKAAVRKQPHALFAMHWP